MESHVHCFCSFQCHGIVGLNWLWRLFVPISSNIIWMYTASLDMIQHDVQCYQFHLGGWRLDMLDYMCDVEDCTVVWWHFSIQHCSIKWNAHPLDCVLWARLSSWRRCVLPISFHWHCTSIPPPLVSLCNQGVVLFVAVFLLHWGSHLRS